MDRGDEAASNLRVAQQRTAPWLVDDSNLPAAPTNGDETFSEPDAFSESPEACPHRPFGGFFSQRLFAHWPGLGLGEPAQRESWTRRPLSVSWLVGGVVGSPVVPDWFGEGSGAIGMLSLGWDFNAYWGTEFRYAYATIDLYDSPLALATQQYYDNLQGLPANDPQRYRNDGGRNGDFSLFSLNALYYPWGDTTWRPYLFVGLGGTKLSFYDCLGEIYNPMLLTMPFGFGLKYHWTDWMALRFEMADNLAFGKNDLDTLHNLSIVGGIEMRFGGAHRSYWPWNPSRSYWQ